MAALMDEEDRQIGRRIFLLDNSGSTEAYDGHHFEELPDGTLMSRPCSRWQEIKHMAMEQAMWNATVGTPCEFVLLNPGPGPMEEGRDFVRMDGGPDAVASLQAMLDRTGPRGVTPLADRLQEIYHRIRTEHEELVRRGQRVVLVIATDGLPTSADSGRSTEADRRSVVQALRRLGAELNVFLVIRLTTDDDAVVGFYNELDRELELPLEVLDDIESEAKEIAQQGNSWLVYSPLLHRIREGGTFVKLFDLLDERRLTATEVALFAQLLLRSEGQAPFPRTAADFCDALEEAVAEAEEVYDPLRRCMGPPIRLSQAASVVVPLGSRVAAAAQLVATTLASVLQGGFASTCSQGPSRRTEFVF